MFSPPVTALYSWYMLRSRASCTLRQLHATLRLEQPEWTVSMDRLRRVRNTLSGIGPTMVVFDADVQLEQRDVIRDTLRPAFAIRSLEDGSNVHPTVSDIAQALGCDKVYCYTHFYERSRNTIHWYYEVYGTEDPCFFGNVNTIGNVFATKATKAAVPTGPILIVKNAPIDTLYNAVIDLDSVVRDIWWYAKSAVDHRTICAERQVERFLVDKF